jgi:hypothetical protein
MIIADAESYGAKFLTPLRQVCIDEPHENLNSSVSVIGEQGKCHERLNRCRLGITGTSLNLERKRGLTFRF